MKVSRTKVLASAREEIDKAAKATRLIHKVPEKVFELCTFAHLSAVDHKLTFNTDSYGNTLLVLSELRTVFKEPLPMSMHMGLGRKIFFYWENADVQVSFGCFADQVPDALMPSKDCTIEEVVKTDKSYAIVCPSKKGAS